MAFAANPSTTQSPSWSELTDQLRRLIQAKEELKAEGLRQRQAARGFLARRHAQAARACASPSAVAEQQLQSDVYEADTAVPSRFYGRLIPLLQPLPSSSPHRFSMNCPIRDDAPFLMLLACITCTHAAWSFSSSGEERGNQVPYMAGSFPWEPGGQVAVSRIKGCNFISILVLANSKISQDVKGLFLGYRFVLDRVKLLTGEGYAAARGRATPKGGSSVMGGQLGLLGHMGPSTVAPPVL